MFIGRVPKISSTSESLNCLLITLLIQHSMLLQNLVTFSHSRKAWTTFFSLLQNKHVDESARFILNRILLVITPLCISLKCMSLENVSNVTIKLSWIFCRRLSFHPFIRLRILEQPLFEHWTINNKSGNSGSIACFLFWLNSLSVFLIEKARCSYSKKWMLYILFKSVLSNSSPSESNTSLTCLISFSNHFFLQIEFPISLYHKCAGLNSLKEAGEHFW